MTEMITILVLLIALIIVAFTLFNRKDIQSNRVIEEDRAETTLHQTIPIEEKDRYEEDFEQRKREATLKLKRIALQIKRQRLEELRNYIHKDLITGEDTRENRVIAFNTAFKENLAFAGFIGGIAGGKTIYDIYQMSMRRTELKEVLEELDPSIRAETAFEIITNYMNEEVAHFLNQYRADLTKEGFQNVKALEAIEQSEIFSDHQNVIDTLRYRNNLEFGPASNEKIWEKLSTHNENTYASHFAGQQAEFLAKRQYEQEGYIAELFPKRNYPNDDLLVTNPETGEQIAVSVKSYSDVNDFLKVMREHPESNHYMVNREVYDELDDKGLIDELQRLGIIIKNGHYSNEELRNNFFALRENMTNNDEYFKEILNQHLQGLREGIDQAESFVETGVNYKEIDIEGWKDLDDISLISALFLVTKTAKNYHHLRKGNKSKHEFSVDLGLDTMNVAGRAVAGGAGVFVGGMVGGAIGTLIAPGIGTATGAAAGKSLGGILGAMSIGNYFNDRKSEIKWGDIFKAQEAVGNYFQRNLGEQIRKKIAENILLVEETKEQLLFEQHLLEEKYRDELDPYSLKMPTLNSVICEQTVHDLKQYLMIIDQMVDKLEKDIYSVCEILAENSSNTVEQSKLMRTYLGEFLIQSEKRLFTDIPEGLKSYVTRYHRNVHKSPNYPTRLPFLTDDFLETKALEYFFENMVKISSLSYQ